MAIPSEHSEVLIKVGHSMLFSLRGVHVPHRKNTKGTSGVYMPPPAYVTLPTAMHIGRPAKVVVKVGDPVCVGTLVAAQDGVVSSPVYSSVSGTVKQIKDIVVSSGAKVPSVVVESDGLMTPDPALLPPAAENREELVDAIAKSGIVGLGGAGFPTYVKFNADPAKIEELILNGAECEPYITSDSVTMCERTEDIRTALLAFQKHLGIKRTVIGIENNKQQAIASMQQLAASMKGVEVKVLPSLYPQGGEKVLVYHTVGKIIPEGKLPLDVGCIVANVTTIAAIGNYLSTGMPLVKKCITVDGGAVKEPKNVIAPIGTAMEDVFAFCGGLTCSPKKVLYGGPMMGIAVPDLSSPILKNTNAILALTEKETAHPKDTACIRCGACTNHCPLGLNPAATARAYQKKDVEAIEALAVNLCMECGCCAFICPANRPLVQTQKLSKALLRAEKDKKAKEEQKS